MTKHVAPKSVAEPQWPVVHKHGKIEDERLPPGWWILPSVVLGLICWIVIIWGLLQLLT
jgi:hypothetical protein